LSIATLWISEFAPVRQHLRLRREFLEDFVMTRNSNGAHMLGLESLAIRKSQPKQVVEPDDADVEALKTSALRLLSLLHLRDCARASRKEGGIARTMLRLAVAGKVAGASHALGQALVENKLPASAAANILENAALLLAQDWREDKASDVDVSIALSVLQTALRRVFAPRNRPLGNGAGAILVTPAPGERHMLGAAILSEILFEAGADVLTEYFTTSDALEKWVAGHWVDAVALHLSLIHPRENLVSTMPRLIAGIRARSANPAVRIAVHAPYSFGELRPSAALGADMTSETTTALAPRLLGWMRERARA
jgi:hypothetical protein